MVSEIEHLKRAQHPNNQVLRAIDNMVAEYADGTGSTHSRAPPSTPLLSNLSGREPGHHAGGGSQRRAEALPG